MICASKQLGTKPDIKRASIGDNDRKLKRLEAKSKGDVTSWLNMSRKWSIFVDGNMVKKFEELDQKEKKIC